jgi:hypothetical protein
VADVSGQLFLLLREGLLRVVSLAAGLGLIWFAARYARQALDAL